MLKAPRPEDYQSIIVDRPASHVFRITLNRPDSRNAQDTTMLYELNDAFDTAARAADVKVIILAARGPHFSAGHDLRVKDFVGDMEPYEPVGSWCGFGCKGAEGRMAVEKEMFLGLSERWRNVPKVTIAQVQGKAIAGGLMLIWPCDLIIASEDAMFADNTLAIGVAGAEFFNHPWELGVRKAKEMLFTSDFVSAHDAHRLGMVNHVVPVEQLEAFTLGIAAKVAQKPSFVLKLTKEALNSAQDAQGRVNAMNTSFALHQLSHAHNVDLFGVPIDPSGLPDALRGKAPWGGAGAAREEAAQ